MQRCPTNCESRCVRSWMWSVSVWAICPPPACCICFSPRPLRHEFQIHPACRCIARNGSLDLSEWLLATRGSHESCCGKRQRKSIASSKACSRGSRSRLTKGRLLQEAEDYDQEHVFRTIAVCTALTLRAGCLSSLAQETQVPSPPEIRPQESSTPRRPRRSP